MYATTEFIRGKPHPLSLYSPRFTSTLPSIDQSRTGGAELQATLLSTDGYDSNACLQIKAYLGGHVHHQELKVWPCTDVLVCEPVVLEAVLKRSQLGNAEKTSRWAWAVRGMIERIEVHEQASTANSEQVDEQTTSTVSSIHTSKQSFCRYLVLDNDIEEYGEKINQEANPLPSPVENGEENENGEKGNTVILRPCFHTSCGEGWERFYWILYPVARDCHVMSIDSISVACERDLYGEDELRVGLFYLNTVELHHQLIQANCRLIDYHH